MPNQLSKEEYGGREKEKKSTTKDRMQDKQPKTDLHNLGSVQIEEGVGA